MVAAVRRQTAPHHMLARRTLTAITRLMGLDTAAIVLKDFRGTHTCKGLVDAKISMSAPKEGHALIPASTRREVSTVCAHQG